MFNTIVRLFTTPAPDFQVLWLASKDLLTSNNPYLNPYIFTGVGYPVNTLLFYLPLTIFNSITAQNIFTILSVISMFVSIYLTLKISKIEHSIVLFGIITLLVLISFPTKFTLGMGQNNFIALAMLLASFYYYKEKKMLLTGLFLGLVISLKTIFIYFLIFFLLKKQWKVVTYLLIMILLTTLIVYLIRGNFDLYAYYVTNVLPPLFRFENREIYTNQGLSGFISRLFSDIDTRRILTGFLSMIFVIYNAFVIYTKKNINLVFSLTTITLLLIDSLAWQHHFVWLLFPVVILYKYSVNITNKLLILLAYILISSNFPNNNLLHDNVFIGTLILYVLNINILI